MKKNVYHNMIIRNWLEMCGGGGIFEIAKNISLFKKEDMNADKMEIIIFLFLTTNEPPYNGNY